jgi:hypothetical protein
MKHFLHFAILYVIGNIIVVSILAGLIVSVLPQKMPLFMLALLFFGFSLSWGSIVFYLYTQRKP